MGLTYEGRNFLGKFLGPIERHLRSIACYTSALSSEGAVTQTAASDLTEATLADTQTTTTGALAESLNLRSVEIQGRSSSDGKLEVVITRADASTQTFRMFTTGTWNFESPMSESPITQVDVENVTGSAVSIEVIINLASR